MKILISEDNDYKYKGIEKYILDIDQLATITRVTYAKAGVMLLKNSTDYDLLIQDMQLPLMSDDRIDIEGGLYVLNQLKRLNIKIKTCICSSDAKAYDLIKEKGFNDVDFIEYNSTYCLKSKFQELLNVVKGVNK